MIDTIGSLCVPVPPSAHFHADRREFPRLPVDEGVCGETLDATGMAFTAIIRDASPKGVRLAVDRPMPISAPLQFHWKQLMFLGEVVYCAPFETGYVVGVLLLQYLDPSPFRTLGQCEVQLVD
jgi:hypothetical protein